MLSIWNGFPIHLFIVKKQYKSKHMFISSVTLMTSCTFPKLYVQRKEPVRNSVTIDNTKSQIAFLVYSFLRPTKGWDPPANIEETIAKICTSHGLKADSTFDALETKYAVLKACFEETGYDVPNSCLHTIECVGMLCNISLFINNLINCVYKNLLL